MTDTETPQASPTDPAPTDPAKNSVKPPPRLKMPPEIGGAPGPEPTRYGDWQHKGRVTDF